MTFCPASVNSFAAISPAAPAPMMMTSIIKDLDKVYKIYALRH
jgi:hypothetical protein